MLISVIAISQRLILSIYPAQQQELFRQHNWIGSTRKPCHVSVVTQASIGNKIAQCITLAPNRRHAVIIGNSHSEQYTPAIRAALPDWDVDYLTMWGCSYEPSATTDETSKKKGCHIYGKEVKNFIESNIQGNDLVFLGFIVSDALVSPKLKDHISTLASSLANRDAKLVLMDDLYLAQANDNACKDGLLPYRLGIQKKQVMQHV
ncbi:MAG: SGNH hydrolase domain-containing protein [Cyanobacteria bacterium]|nr:SGNH hydrolase domain-containing protein [Cyanobacteriota bacterium]